MKTIFVARWTEVPDNFTGKIEFNKEIRSALGSDLSAAYLLNGKRHRLDGPAMIFSYYDEYWINDEFICSSSHKDHKQFFYIAVKQWMLLQNFKKIKNIS